MFKVMYDNGNVYDRKHFASGGCADRAIVSGSCQCQREQERTLV